MVPSILSYTAFYSPWTAIKGVCSFKGQEIIWERPLKTVQLSFRGSCLCAGFTGRLLTDYWKTVGWTHCFCCPVASPAFPFSLVLFLIFHLGPNLSSLPCPHLPNGLAVRPLTSLPSCFHYETQSPEKPFLVRSYLFSLWHKHILVTCVLCPWRLLEFFKCNLEEDCTGSV